VQHQQPAGVPGQSGGRHGEAVRAVHLVADPVRHSQARHGVVATASVVDDDPVVVLAADQDVPVARPARRRDHVD